MITHAIVHHRPHQHVPIKQDKDRPKFKAGSKEHLNYIFVKTVEYSKENYPIGAYVTHIHGSGDSMGHILSIRETVEECEWSHLKCRPIEVWWWDKGVSQFYHPGELVVFEGEV